MIEANPLAASPSESFYAILFAWLLQLDARDTSICVLMTWILVAAVNYAAFRFQGLQSDAWL